MSRAVENAENAIRYALDAAHAVDRDELPDEIVDDVDRAILMLLKAKGNCEVNRREVSA